MFPVLVSGPESFMLMVVWSKGSQPFPYVEGVVRGVQIYRKAFQNDASVLIGDLNSNVIWDHEHPRERNHSALTSVLTELGLVSAYHTFHGEAHGQESRATYYFHWKQDRGFHIDYCFVPKAWATSIRSVEVGSYEAWRSLSDHRPLLVDVQQSAGSQVARPK
jgi:endonuclease/exonuclease/phosphatase family metal-dependent hydrolase